MSLRLRIATDGHRGTTSNRRISVATFGFRPSTVLEGIWKEVVDFTMYIRRSVEVTLIK